MFPQMFPYFFSTQKWNLFLFNLLLSLCDIFLSDSLASCLSTMSFIHITKNFHISQIKNSETGYIFFSCTGSSSTMQDNGVGVDTKKPYWGLLNIRILYWKKNWKNCIKKSGLELWNHLNLKPGVLCIKPLKHLNLPLHFIIGIFLNKNHGMWSKAKVSCNALESVLACIANTFSFLSMVCLC